MNIIFFDDDCDYLEKCKDLMVTHNLMFSSYFYSGANDVARHLRQRQEASLYFLDLLESGHNSGVQLAEEIHRFSPQSMVVYVTAYPEHIVFDSQSKLLSINQIHKHSKVWADEIMTSIAYATGHLDKTSILYKVGQDELHRIVMDRVIFAETLKRQNRILIHTDRGRFIVRDTLLAFMEKAGDYTNLLRCHNSYLVNIRWIDKLLYREKKIIFLDGSECFYSASKAKELISRWSIRG